MKNRWTFGNSIREFWKTGKAGVALFFISIFVLIYGNTALEFEVSRGWNGHESVQNVMKDISSFVPVGGAIVAMIIGGIDFIMLLSDWYAERNKRLRQIAREEGKAEGEAKGIAKGKVEERELWIAWNNRRLEAEAKGEKFNEPPPTETQHLTE